MNCYYETAVNTMWHLEKFNTTVAVSFSNSNLTILLTERGGAPLSFVGFWRPPMPPPLDATILNYLNDRERGRH